jgi:hypothetical protein
MTEQIRKALDDTWQSVRPRVYRSKGWSFGKRDQLWVVAFSALWAAFYVAHDVMEIPIPVPSSEAMGFGGSLIGLYVGRRFRR